MCQWKFFVLMYSANTSARRVVRALEISLVALDVRFVGVLSGAILRDLASLGSIACISFWFAHKKPPAGRCQTLLNERQQIGIDPGPIPSITANASQRTSKLACSLSARQLDRSGFRCATRKHGCGRDSCVSPRANCP